HKPNYGGHTWVFLQYLLGFRRLGFDVLFLDRLEPEMQVDYHAAFVFVRSLLKPFGLDESLAIVCNGGRETLGVPRGEILEKARRSVLLLNVMGFLVDEDILAVASRRVYLDIDPGFSQMWRELGLADTLSGHNRFLTVGGNIGRSTCSVPTCGLDWVPTRPPVVFDEWPEQNGGGPFTTVGAWRGPFAPVKYLGKTYGLRVHEFRQFASLPQITGQDFEAALDIDPRELGDIKLLRDNGWSLVDPGQVTASPSAYRAYI